MGYKTSLDVSFLSRKSIDKGDIHVGIVFPGYGYERVSYALPVNNVSFKRTYSIPIHRVFKKNNFYKNTPIIVPSKVDLLHTWNVLPVAREPFVVSFENEIPRYFGAIQKWQENLGLSVLKSSRCKAILALSDIAAELARQKMRKLGYPEVASKIGVFRGGVQVGLLNNHSIKEIEKEPDGGVLKVIFIGGDLFPKGFVPAFEALESLIEEGVEVKLTVIGKFKQGAYALKEYSPDPLEWDAVLSKADWVTHHEGLDNKDVIKELSKSDLLIFPSYDESLGWAVIEAGLLGVPAITTNVFALPELVRHDVSGYVIDLSLGKQSRWKGIWATGLELKEEIRRANKKIYLGIRHAIAKIANNPETLKAWGQESNKHMERLYDVDKAGCELSKIYSQAMNNQKQSQ